MVYDVYLLCELYLLSLKILIFVSFITNKEIWVLLVRRLILIPAICFGIFYLFGISGIVANIVLILEACPTAAITSVFAIQFNHDENLAAGAVVLTTLCSIITLPMFAILLTMLS